MEKENDYNVRMAFISDYPYMEQCLLDEGFDTDQHSFKNDYAFITDIGFFSWTLLGATPWLRHLYVNADNRNRRTAIYIRRIFETMLFNMGYERYVAEVPKEKPEMERFIKYLGGTEPYTEIDGNKFYIVPIGERNESLHKNRN